MINDSNIQSDVSSQNRRNKARTAYSGEAVLRWSHDFDTPVRYNVVDRSAGGMQITSQFPLSEGMTGVVTRYLPEGTAVHQPMMVAWSSSEADDDGYRCGIWFFGSN
ncbi:MAG: PilZ domain-containing protein [Phycisphaerales bacterium]|nr:PilZ domain-containing protein [Phycisphaerales bacterium]